MAENNAPVETETREVSSFQRYVENPEVANQLMRILSNLYNRPMKISQVQPYLKEMFKVEEINPDLEDALRNENAGLSETIFDL